MTKNDIIERFKDIDFMYNDSSRLDTLSRMIDELLQSQPQIVRCKDCRWGDPVKNGYGEDVIECTEDIEHRCHATDWFCADGESK